MINVKELRLGNFIASNKNNDIFQVKEIFDAEILEQRDKSKMEYDYFSPIPLTEEWLLKFGFKKESSIVFVKWENYKTIKMLLYYHLGGRENITYKPNQNEEIEIKSVHQLQNLYFALSGEELPIGENDTAS